MLLPAPRGVLPYICSIGMEGMVFARFGLKTGIHVAYFGLNSGTVFKEMHERICRFNSKGIRKKEYKYANTRGILKDLFVGGVLI